MSIKSLVTKLRSDAGTGAVVDHIHAHHFPPGASEAHYLEEYFDLDVRRRFFDGGTTSGRYLLLSPAAQRPTSTAEIARMMAGTGSKLANGHVGNRVCFFTDSDRADGYLAPIVVPPEGGGAAVVQVILVVVVDSRRASDGVLPTGSDEVADYHQPSTIMTVKDPLVIFPKAVYMPGVTLTNVVNPDPTWKG